MEDKSLPEYKQKLDELYALISAVLKMDLHIPMELLSLDCNTINQVRILNILKRFEDLVRRVFLRELELCS